MSKLKEVGVCQIVNGKRKVLHAKNVYIIERIRGIL
jgi:hypothetical protein